MKIENTLCIDSIIVGNIIKIEMACFTKFQIAEAYYNGMVKTRDIYN